MPAYISFWLNLQLKANRASENSICILPLPESLMRVFPAWAYCQQWLSNTAIVNQKLQWTVLPKRSIH